MLLPVALLCCTGGESRPKTLAVSIEPQRYLLERIVGEGWVVETMLSKGEDPESFDPTTADFKRLHDSRAYFVVGTLPFESRITGLLDNKMEVVDTGLGVTRLTGTHSHCHHHHEHSDSEHHSHDEPDPHIWTSLSNSKVMAANMLKAMVRISPSDSVKFNDNYRKLMSHLDSCDAQARRLLSVSPNAMFMVWHPSLSYFARDYTLRQLSVGSENKELSVNGFRKAIDEARHEGATLFLAQPDFDSQRSVAVASQAGVPDHTVNTLAYDMPAELCRIAKLLHDSELCKTDPL